MLQIVYVMIIIHCEGHTNSDCTLQQQYYNTFQECADAQWIEETNWISGRVKKVLDAGHRICMATPKSEAAFQ